MAAWEIKFTDRARDDLQSIPHSDRVAIYQAVHQLAQDAPNMDCKKLKGLPGQWRLRVGNWRVFFEKDKPTHALVILRVLNRKDAY